MLIPESEGNVRHDSVDESITGKPPGYTDDP